MYFVIFINEHVRFRKKLMIIQRCWSCVFVSALVLMIYHFSISSMLLQVVAKISRTVHERHGKLKLWWQVHYGRWKRTPNHRSNPGGSQHWVNLEKAWLFHMVNRSLLTSINTTSMVYFAMVGGFDSSTTNSLSSSSYVSFPSISYVFQPVSVF